MVSDGVVKIFTHFKARFAWTWAPEESLAKRDLLLLLKGPLQDRLWKDMAERFLSQHLSHLDNRYREILVVPIPAKAPGQRDHAMLWAESLADLTGGSLFPALISNSPTGEQKQRDREARRAVHFGVEKSLRKELLQRLKSPQTQLVVADDVVTSGSTATAAWMALGRPKSCEIWALAYRTTLRNGGKI